MAIVFDPLEKKRHASELYRSEVQLPTDGQRDGQRDATKKSPYRALLCIDNDICIYIYILTIHKFVICYMYLYTYTHAAYVYGWMDGWMNGSMDGGIYRFMMYECMGIQNLSLSLLVG